MTRVIKQTYQSGDGKTRDAKIEREINEALAICFSDAVGERALKYLRSITIEKVSGPGLDVNALIHQEGARWLVAVIERRIADAKENKPDVS